MNNISADNVSTTDYYRVVVRPREDFTRFRTQDVGKPGGIQRVAGLTRHGRWATQAWLVHKDMAHISRNKLVADHPDVKELIATLPHKPEYIEDNLFTAQN